MSRYYGSGPNRGYGSSPLPYHREPQDPIPEHVGFRPLPTPEDNWWFDPHFRHGPPSGDYEHALITHPYGRRHHDDHSYIDPTRSSLLLNERQFGPKTRDTPREPTIKVGEQFLTPDMFMELNRTAAFDAERNRQLEEARLFDSWIRQGPAQDEPQSAIPPPIESWHEEFPEAHLSEMLEETLATGLELGLSGSSDALPQEPSPPDPFEPDLSHPPAGPELMAPAADLAPLFEAPHESLEQIVEREAPSWEPPLPDPVEEMSRQFDQQMQMMDPFHQPGPMGM